MLCGIDQFPESRSMVFSEELPGDFSEGCGPVTFMFAVRVDMEGRVWFEAAGVVGPETDSHGRWATESMSGGVFRKGLVVRVCRWWSRK